MTDADQILQGRQIAGLEARVEIAEDEIGKIRQKAHDLANLTVQSVIGFPVALARLAALEIRIGVVEARVTAVETRAATLEGLTPRVERVEQSVLLVKSTADGTQRTITTAGSVVGKFLDRFLWPILVAVALAWLFVKFGLK